MKIIMFLMLWDTERSGRGTGGEAYWNAIILLRLLRSHLP